MTDQAMFEIDCQELAEMAADRGGQTAGSLVITSQDPTVGGEDQLAGERLGERLKKQLARKRRQGHERQTQVAAALAPDDSSWMLHAGGRASAPRGDEERTQ